MTITRNFSVLANGAGSANTLSLGGATLGSNALAVTGTTALSGLLTAAGGVSSTLTTDATSATTGSIITAGGISTQKALWVGTTSQHVGAATFNAAITYGGVTLSNAVTGTGNMVLSANPLLTGTVQFGDGNTHIVGGEFYITAYGYRTGYDVNSITTNWPGFTGITNDSDETLKVQKGDALNYWEAAKEVHAANLISDFDIYQSPEKTGQGIGGFGVKSAQQMFDVFGGLGVHQPDDPITPEEQAAFDADQALPEDERKNITLRRVNPYWSANCETWGLIALKIASAAAVKIDDLEARVAALEARLEALEAK